MNTAVLTFKQSAIKGLASLLTNEAMFTQVLQAVQSVEYIQTFGHKKRTAVIKELEVTGLKMDTELLPLMIELSVIYLRLGTEQHLNKHKGIL